MAPLAPPVHTLLSRGLPTATISGALPVMAALRPRWPRAGWRPHGQRAVMAAPALSVRRRGVYDHRRTGVRQWAFGGTGEARVAVHDQRGGPVTAADGQYSRSGHHCRQHAAARNERAS